MQNSPCLTVHEAAKAYGCSRSQFYVLIKCGLMVPPIRRGKGGRWPASEIELIKIERFRRFTAAERLDRRPDEQIRTDNIKALVAQLVRERTEPELSADSIADSLGIPRAS